MSAVCLVPDQTFSAHFHISFASYIIVDGAFSGWIEWTSCSVSCGTGSRSRSRDCTNPSPEHGGGNCVGSTTDEEMCNTVPCPGNSSVDVKSGDLSVGATWAIRLSV